jgi:hypothetical protein
LVTRSASSSISTSVSPRSTPISATMPAPITPTGSPATLTSAPVTR